MLDLLWIIPNLNEEFDVVRRNVETIESFSKKNGFEYLITLVDGGSKTSLLTKIKTLINKNIKLFLVLPGIRPTKNKGIKDMVSLFKSKYVGIIDSDCLNINDQVLSDLILPLNKSDISLPYTTKKGGRVNRLICNPLISILFPEAYKKIRFPLSGIIAMKHRLLRRITQRDDYFWDWGGEIQIIINSSKMRSCKVHEFLFNKQDAKKRTLDSKKEDAKMLMRAIIYEAIKSKRVSPKWKTNFNFVKKYEQEKSYEAYTVRKMVLDVIEEILFNRPKRGMLISPQKEKVDFLGFDTLNNDLSEIYKYYLKIFLQEEGQEKFLKEVSHKISIQKNLSSFKSLDLKNIANIDEIVSEYYHSDKSIFGRTKENVIG